MNKFEEVLGRLTEDEKLAMDILSKNGWLPYVDVQVEKAVIEDSKYQTYSVGGYYDIGFLKAQVPPRPKARTKTKKGKKG